MTDVHVEGTPETTPNPDQTTVHDLIERVTRLEEGKAEKEHYHDEYAMREHSHDEYATHDEIPTVTNVSEVTQGDIESLRNELYDAIDAIDEDLSESIGEAPHTEIETPNDTEERKETPRLRLLW